VAQLTRPTGPKSPRRVQQARRDLSAKHLRSLPARPWARHGGDFIPAAAESGYDSDY
jgi:hypothetical protein